MARSDRPAQASTGSRAAATGWVAGSALRAPLDGCLSPTTTAATTAKIGAARFHFDRGERREEGAQNHSCHLMPWTGETRSLSVGLMITSVAFGGLTYSGHHINHIDLSPTYAPVLYGITNTFANLAAIIGPTVGGAILGEQPGGPSSRRSNGGWSSYSQLESRCTLCPPECLPS